MGEFSALKKAIDDSMVTIKRAKNAIKDAINTVGEPLGVRVDDTDTFRSYGEKLTGKPDGQSDYIRLLYQRIWSSDDNTDAPKKCIITNDDFPAAPMHNYGYIDINDKSAKEFGDEDKYVAVSSFIVDIRNPPVYIGSKDNYFIGYILSIEHGTTPRGPYPGSLPDPEVYDTICGGLMENPVDLQDRDIGRYMLLSTDIRTYIDGEYVYSKLPGGLYAANTYSYEMNTKVTIFAYGKEETFEFLGTWAATGYRARVGIWRRLTGGD